jgi:prephenate dehydratase
MLFPDADLVGQRTFAAAFDDLQEERADAAVLPVENSTAGAVSDVYDLLLGHDDLTVVGEAILPVRHCLLGLPGATLAAIRAARSHPQALAQSEAYLRQHGIEPREAYDTAAAAGDTGRPPRGRREDEPRVRDR